MLYTEEFKYVEQDVVETLGQGQGAENHKSLYNDLFHYAEGNLKKWSSINQQNDGYIDVLDFFSGCGGMSLGFASLSLKIPIFKIKGGIDINDLALKTFSSNFKAKTLSRDIREIYAEDNIAALKDYFELPQKKERPLIVIGCAPCQGFSSHRKKNWFKTDERNTLIGAFIEIATKLNPDFIVMENVPEILGKKYWNHYEEARKILTEKNFKIKQTIYNCASFGVPQERFRAIIIASKANITLPKEIYSQSEFKTVRNAIGKLEEIAPGEKSSSDSYHRSANHKASTIKTIQQIPKDGGKRPVGVGPKCLDKVNGFSDVYGRLHWDKPSITITQYARNPASGRYVHPEQDRGLTIREAARLQSFPDGFEFTGSLDANFAQIGEAVPPLLSCAIATSILIDLSINDDTKKIESKINQISEPVNSSYSSVISSLKRK